MSERATVDEDASVSAFGSSTKPRDFVEKLGSNQKIWSRAPGQTKIPHCRQVLSNSPSFITISITPVSSSWIINSVGIFWWLVVRDSTVHQHNTAPTRWQRGLPRREARSGVVSKLLVPWDPFLLAHHLPLGETRFQKKKLRMK